MSPVINVVRYHLVDWMLYVALPWTFGTFAFLVNLVIFAIVPTPESGAFHTAGLVTFYVWLFIPAVLTVSRALPFGLALGLSRRTYYLGTIVLMLGLTAAYALGLTGLQVVERATNGWGVAMHFFRIPWLLDGPWYVTLLTSFVLLALVFIYGMWSGLVYKRWYVVGLSAFIASQILVLLAGAVAITWLDLWSRVGEFFGTLSILGLTGVLAVVVAALTVGGFTTIRRVAV
jgi:hypothetical protein